MRKIMGKSFVLINVDSFSVPNKLLISRLALVSQLQVRISVRRGRHIFHAADLEVAVFCHTS